MSRETAAYKAGVASLASEKSDAIAQGYEEVTPDLDDGWTQQDAWRWHWDGNGDGNVVFDCGGGDADGIDDDGDADGAAVTQRD